MTFNHSMKTKLMFLRKLSKQTILERMKADGPDESRRSLGKSRRSSRAKSRRSFGLNGRSYVKSECVNTDDFDVAKVQGSTDLNDSYDL